MKDLSNKIDEIVELLEGTLALNEDKAAAMIGEIEKLRQYTDNLLHMNNEYEQTVKKERLSNALKHDFSEIVFNSRIYEFVHSELVKAKESFEQIHKRLQHLHFMYQELKMDCTMMIDSQASRASQKAVFERIATSVRVSQEQFKACAQEHEKVNAQAISFLEEAEKNHLEIDKLVRGLNQGMEEATLQKVKPILQSIETYSERISELAHQLNKGQINDSEIGEKFTSILKKNQELPQLAEQKLALLTNVKPLYDQNESGYQQQSLNG